MIDTAALRALLAQTTQGEWYTFVESKATWFTGVFAKGAAFDGGGKQVGDIFNRDSVRAINGGTSDDAAFIATAHNTMPALLDEIDTLRAEIARYQAHVADNDHYYVDGDINEDPVQCQGCDATYLVGDCDAAQHAPGCIVAEARAAQYHI